MHLTLKRSLLFFTEQNLSKTARRSVPWFINRATMMVFYQFCDTERLRVNSDELMKVLRRILEDRILKNRLFRTLGDLNQFKFI